METKCKVFTPLSVANYMLDAIGYTGNVYGKKIVDNSCGAGNILYAVVKRYIDALHGESPEYIKAGLEKDIKGIEIDVGLCEDTRKRLDALAQKNGIDNVCWNIICSDALKQNACEEYDYIIGNPPYISYRHLDMENRKQLKKRFSSCKTGSFDYCYAFIEQSIASLKPHGKMIYLIPSSIFKNVHASHLREILLGVLTEIHDYTTIKLFGKVMTSSALIVCMKGDYRASIQYRDMAADRSWDIKKDELGPKWMFNVCSEPPARKRMRFGDFFSASIVVATLLNEAYVLSNYEDVGDGYILCNDCLIEKAVVRETASPRGFRNKKKELIIFPYYYVDGTLHRYSEEDFSSLFPKAEQYLKRHAENLAKRAADRSATWFEYGRSQALARINQDKLLVSTVVTDRVEVYPLDAQCIPYAGIFITPKGDCSLETAYRILSDSNFYEYVKNIGIYANGRSIRISPKDIENYEYET